MRKFCAIFLTALLAFSHAANADFYYLFDAMKDPSYQTAWKKLMRGEQLPLWLKILNTKKGNYVADSVIYIPSNGDPYAYECFWICKPHNCHNENMNVLFTKNATEAWGMLIEESKSEPRWFGQPDDKIKEILRNCESYK